MHLLSISMNPYVVIAILALFGHSSASPANVPGGRLLPPGSPGDRGSIAGGASAADKYAINENLRCSGDLSTRYNKTCWDTLGITQFVLNWEKNVPKCGVENYTCIETGCASDEPWSSCFLRLATGTPDYNCTQINVGHCTMESFHLRDPKSKEMPQYRYVARNIFAINNFFVNWYAAMEFATAQSALAVPSIIATLDPDKKTDTTRGTIIGALTAGLALLSIPSMGALVPATTSAIGSLLVTGLQQAPGVAQALWPSDDPSTQVIQMGELASELGRFSTDIGHTLDNGLSVIMNNVSAFAQFASAGAFSGQDVPSIPKETVHLDLGFKTYLVTKAMVANDWLVFWGPPDGADGAWFNSTPDSNAEKFKCNPKPEGICDTIDSRGVPPLCQPGDWGTYTSPASHRAYYPSQQHGRNDPPSARLLHAIADNKWGTLDTIFDGAYECTVNGGGASGAPPVVRVLEGGRFDFSCLSQLRMETGCKELASKGWEKGCNYFFERLSFAKIYPYVPDC